MCDVQHLQTLKGQWSGLIELLELCFQCIQAIQENELPKVILFDNLTKQAFICNTWSMFKLLKDTIFIQFLLFLLGECLPEVYWKFLVKCNLFNGGVLGVIQTECNKEFRAKIHSR